MKPDTRSTPARCPYCGDPCSLCQCPPDSVSALMHEVTRYWIDDCPVVDPIAFRTLAERAFAWGKQQSAQSESAPIWKPYPAEKPKANKDARHLVILVTGDVYWVGIRFYNHERGHWSGRGNEGENGEQVWYFKPLLADGESLPTIPNSREQADDPSDTPEIRWQRTTR